MGLWSFWLILAVGFLITEILTMSMTFLYIGIGALAAMVCAFINAEWIPTILTFVISTVVLYLATYHWRRKISGYLHKTNSDAATGMDALIGRTGTVMDAADTMRIRIDGDVWQIRTEEPHLSLRPGDRVRVVGYDSIVLTVTPITDKTQTNA